jgi:hypothetical protein
MRRHAIVLGLAFVGLALFALFAGWVSFEGGRMAGGGRFLGPLWPYLVGGLAVLVALAGFLAWLATYASNHGPQARIDPEGH